ncbi:MAG: sigma 54-interacting transcriptional regulator, partial [Vicinamibacterales bacterium]
AVLTATCVRLREALRAAAAGFVVPQGTSFRLLATDGGRLDITTGGRACSAGQRITIVPTAGGLETGLPVNCGGRTVGALALRWNPGGTPCPDRVAAWMTVASALAAPSLAAAVRGSGSATAEEIVGDSDGMVAVRRAVDRAAPAPFPVLIEGESGSGKELVARALHRRSPRRDRSFVALNCAAIPDDLLEAELFGHARGAFTGALIERPGVFEEAHGGTLFLDEVGELSPRAQAKLLRVLQEGEVRRIGENVPRRVDVRVVAATNRDLRAEVAAARFRIDLMYRLDVVRIAVPPLRERITDLPVLVDRFWRQATDRVQSRAVLSSATLATLARHTWPGNVRELQNVLASLAVRAPRRGVVMPSALPWSGEAAVDSPLRLDLARREFEIRFVRAALVRNGGHRARAACELGLSRQGLTKLMARLGVADGVVPPGGCREPGR